MGFECPIYYKLMPWWFSRVMTKASYLRVLLTCLVVIYSVKKQVFNIYYHLCIYDLGKNHLIASPGGQASQVEVVSSSSQSNVSTNMELVRSSPSIEKQPNDGGDLSSHIITFYVLLFGYYMYFHPFLMHDTSTTCIKKFPNSINSCINPYPNLVYKTCSNMLYISSSYSI